MPPSIVLHIPRSAPSRMINSVIGVHKPKFHPLGSSRLDTTRSTCQAHRDELVEPRCLTSSTQQKCMGSTRQTCQASQARRIEHVQPYCSTSSTQPKFMGSTRQACRASQARRDKRVEPVDLVMSSVSSHAV